jgi:GDP-4-dehydro-6-deoxy-D-mannose reductase
MKNILITGANGFIGSNLIDFIIKKKFLIYALDLPGISFQNLAQYINRDKRTSEINKLKIFGDDIQIATNVKNLLLIECDLKNKTLLEEIIRSVKPKYIFHFGAQPYVNPSWKDPVNTIETNVIGTLNVFEPVKYYDIKSKILITCTSAEFGSTAKIGRPLKESDPLMAIHPYGISKIAAELLARQYYINFGIHSVILRFFNQTGPRKPIGAAVDFAKKVAEIDLGLRDPVIEVGNLDSYRDFTGIKDTIQAIWLASKKGKPGETYQVCSGRKIQIRELLNIALSFSNKKIKIIEKVSDKLRRFDEDMIIGDNSKIKRELGFKITQSIEKVLKDIYDYWVEFYQKSDLLN